MAQTLVNFRMDEELKKSMESICQELGINMTTAFTIFAKAVVREREIPFKLSAEPKDMTEHWTPAKWEDVKEKLKVAEEQFEYGKSKDAFMALEELKAKHGL